MANGIIAPKTARITFEKVRDLFDYRDGKLYWKQRRPGVNAGKEAGCESRGYRLVRIDDVLYRYHRLVFLWHHKYMPEEIDHIDGNSLNSAIENLRAVTRSENNWNRKIRGTSFHKQARKWRAYIVVNNKQRALGLFATEEEAHAAYVAAKSVLHVIPDRP